MSLESSTTCLRTNPVLPIVALQRRFSPSKTYEEIALEDAIPTARVRKAIRYARPHRVARCRSILRS